MWRAAILGCRKGKRYILDSKSGSRQDQNLSHPQAVRVAIHLLAVEGEKFVPAVCIAQYVAGNAVEAVSGFYLIGTGIGRGFFRACDLRGFRSRPAGLRTGHGGSGDSALRLGGNRNHGSDRQSCRILDLRVGLKQVFHVPLASVVAPRE